MRIRGGPESGGALLRLVLAIDRFSSAAESIAETIQGAGPSCSRPSGRTRRRTCPRCKTTAVDVMPPPRPLRPAAWLAPVSAGRWPLAPSTRSGRLPRDTFTSASPRCAPDSTRMWASGCCRSRPRARSWRPGVPPSAGSRCSPGLVWRACHGAADGEGSRGHGGSGERANRSLASHWPLRSPGASAPTSSSGGRRRSRSRRADRARRRNQVTPSCQSSGSANEIRPTIMIQ